MSFLIRVCAMGYPSPGRQAPYKPSPQNAVWELSFAISVGCHGHNAVQGHRWKGGRAQSAYPPQ